MYPGYVLGTVSHRDAVKENDSLIVAAEQVTSVIGGYVCLSQTRVAKEGGGRVTIRFLLWKPPSCRDLKSSEPRVMST